MENNYNFKINNYDSKIKDNLNKSVLYASGANFLTAFVLFIVFVISKEYLYLIASVILILAGVAFIFMIKSLQRRIKGYSDKSGSNNSGNNNSDQIMNDSNNSKIERKPIIKRNGK